MHDIEAGRFRYARFPDFKSPRFDFMVCSSLTMFVGQNMNALLTAQLSGTRQSQNWDTANSFFSVLGSCDLKRAALLAPSLAYRLR